jgi:hypothetical protein
VLTAIRNDTKWTDYEGGRGPERVGIDAGGTRIRHRLDSTNIMEEIHINGQKWVCSDDFNNHSLWDGNGREPTGSLARGNRNC